MESISRTCASGVSDYIVVLVFDKPVDYTHILTTGQLKQPMQHNLEQAFACIIRFISIIIILLNQSVYSLYIFSGHQAMLLINII